MLTIDAVDLPSYQIVLPATPSVAERRAAEVLFEYLGRITGARLTVVEDTVAARETEILLGHNARLDQLGVRIDFASLGGDGFALKTIGRRLVIAGGAEQGTLYGVYSLLEEYLGCRRYTPEVEVVPCAEELRLPDLDVVQIPSIEFREAYYRSAWDPAFAEWHKLDNHEQDWGMWVHTFAALLPPEEYFAAHPEHFSLVKGQRVPNGQLCLTNPEVLRIVVKNLRQRIEANPRARYWSVSQNDTYGNCECDRCRALDEREGTPMGSLLTFVNQVAAEFPDRVISTLGYQYSRKAPRTLKPAANVNIVLCTIELNRSRPIAADPTAASFRQDMEDWARICPNLVVWDYVIQFSNLVSPFPNLRVLQPNIRYFRANHSTALFQQGNREIGGELAELRTYLIAKLLWNPDVDVEALTKDFLTGYYGPAGPYLRRYLDRIHDELERSGTRLDIFGNPVAAGASHLTPTLLDQYEDILDQAERAVADQAAYLERVRVARLPLEYARLEQAKARPTGPRGLFQRGGSGGWEIRPEIAARLDRFVSGCNRQGVIRVTEWHTTPDEYRTGYMEVLERRPLDHLAVGKRVISRPDPSPKYPADGLATLTDGLHGPQDHAFAWLGFEGTDVELVVDLERRVPVRRVAADFLQSVASWILLPLKVEFAVSLDGTAYQVIGTAAAQAEERRGGIFAETFAGEGTPIPVRFVRVKVTARKTCPTWHLGAGSPCWAFIDEIVVE